MADTLELRSYWETKISELRRRVDSATAQQETAEETYNEERRRSEMAKTKLEAAMLDLSVARRDLEMAEATLEYLREEK